MPEQVTDEDLELLGDLGVDTAPETKGGRSAREQRIIAGFEEIERFVEQNGRLPRHGEGLDIFERLYAVRLDRIRESAECREVLKGLDPRGLLNADGTLSPVDESESDEELLATLGADDVAHDDVTKLVHVRSREEIQAAEEIARRTRCEDFDQFRPIFERVQQELDSGARKTVKYKEYADIKKGDLFILEGQKVIVADRGTSFVTDYDRTNRRLRVIYDNGTESDLLLRSLQRALYKDPSSRRITDLESGTLFSEVETDDDQAAGYIYVLRSLSDHPFVVQNRAVMHKIGVTGGSVKSRIAGAKKDPTYLLADVEVVAEYRLANVNRKKLETLLHKFFATARFDMELKDRFGANVEPREWFLVPLSVIEEAIRRIKDGTLGDHRYDRETARLVT